MDEDTDDLTLESLSLPELWSELYRQRGWRDVVDVELATVTDAKLARMRDKVCVLASALGLDPKDIPEDGHIGLDDNDTLYVERYVRTSDGKVAIDHDAPVTEMAVITVETDIYAVEVE